MYTRYWQLDTRPFEPQPASGKPFELQGQQGALLKLRYAIECRREAVVLAGASGVGKTFLTDELARQFDTAEVDILRLKFPELSPRELLNWIATELGTAPEPTDLPSADQSLRTIEAALIDRVASGQTVALAIDDAQLLEDAGLLETLRLLSNMSHEGRPLATLLLIGQPELLSIIGRSGGLAQRVSQVAVLNPFDAAETGDYLQYRLQAAGAQQEIITPGGVAALVELSGGVPRLVNRLADLALVVGFAEGAAHVDRDLVESVSGELTLLHAA